MDGYYTSMLLNPFQSYQSPAHSQYPRASQLYSEKIQHIQSQYRYLNEEKMQDMKDIEQDEYYLQKLREQRDKMNSLKNEFDNKIIYIQQLEAELNQYNVLKGNYECLIEINQEQNLKNEYLVNEIKKLNDEKGELEKQNSLNNKQNKQLSQQIKKLTNNNENYKQALQEKHFEIELLKKSLIDKESNEQMLEEQLQNQLIEENYFKNENLQLKFELQKLQEYQKQIQEQIHFQGKQNEQKIKDQEKLIKEKQETIDELQITTKDLKTEFDEILENSEFKLQSTLKKINDLSKAINEKQDILKKQDQVIREFKQKNIDDDIMIQQLEEELKRAQEQISEYNNFRNTISNEYETLESKNKDLEQELEKLKKQNSELKNEIKDYKIKEENQKKYRQEIERMKQELAQTKLLEVQQFNEAFNNLIKQPSEINPHSTRVKSHHLIDSKQLEIPQRYIYDSKLSSKQGFFQSIQQIGFDKKETPRGISLQSIQQNSLQQKNTFQKC